MRRLGWILLGCSHTVLSAEARQLSMEQPLGLYKAEQFVRADAVDKASEGSPQARWYFAHETFLVPRAGQALTTVSQDRRGAEDIQSLDLQALPGLVWTGSSQQWTHVRLLDDTQVQLPAGTQTRFEIVAQLPTNQSYWNQATQAFYAQRTASIRGEQTGEHMLARTLWPEDFTLDLQAAGRPLQAGESLQQLVQYAQGGARSPYESRLLWEKTPGTAKQLAGKAALGLLLNGAQGDDDEAHGGHFALATGVVGSDGSYQHWLVNNYYNLASHSEKGIIAAVTPMDKYMADLNSGQGFYRPSYMLVAIFSTPQIPQRIQAASNRVFEHFYRNDFVYDHARNNCAGVSMDTLRNLGWQVPVRGVESLFKASAAYWYVAAAERSLQKGRAMYDYLNTEMTRLFPAVAFDAIGNDLLNIAYTGNKTSLTSAAMQPMVEQLEAIYFIRLPQIPSSRAYGLAPVYSFAQYLQQAPADRSQWKIIPVTPNPLPDELKAGLARQPQTPGLIPLPAIILLVSILGVAGALLGAVLKALARCRLK